MMDTGVEEEMHPDETTPKLKHRDRSTIDFPYMDLDTAVEVAKAIYERAGLGACTVDELTAQMKTTASGTFRMKTAAAKLFELVEKEGRFQFRLSSLGIRIVQAETEKEARAEAFLNVPLYKAMYEKYRGHYLPSATAREQEMKALGVPPKQTDKARLAFERSARQAGYFNETEDRLVQPRFDREPPTKTPKDANGEVDDGETLKEVKEKAGSRHPFIEGLLKTLPEPESDWSATDQAKWLQTAASIFGLIYKSDGSVRVEAQINKKNDGQQ